MSLGCSFKVCGVQYGTYVVRQCVPRWGKPRSMNVLCTLTRDNNADRRLERARLETCLVFTDCVIRMSNEWKKVISAFHKSCNHHRLCCCTFFLFSRQMSYVACDWRSCVFTNFLTVLVIDNPFRPAEIFGIFTGTTKLYPAENAVF